MSLLFRSKRRDDGSIPASSVRQRAGREQIRREIASEVEYAESYDPSGDWSLELVDMRAALDGVPNRQTGPEFDPVTGELVAPARRPAPWFQLGREDHRVHSGGVDGNLDRKWEGR